MRTNFLKFGIGVLAVCLLTTSCKNSTGSTSGSTAQMSFAVKSDNASLTLNSTAGGTLATQATTTTPANVTWTSGVANISAFKLEAKKRGVEIEVKSKSLTTVDIFATIPPAIVAVIDTGTYTEIELRVELAKSSGTDIPLVLKGTFKSTGGVTVPIEVDFNDDVTIKASAENITVDGAKDISTFVNIHLNRLMANVSSADIDAASRTSGAIVISSTVNAAIYSKIKLNFVSCGDAGGFEKHDK